MAPPGLSCGLARLQVQTFLQLVVKLGSNLTGDIEQIYQVGISKLGTKLYTVETCGLHIDFCENVYKKVPVICVGGSLEFSPSVF